MALLYDPSPLDRRIETPIRHDGRTGKYVNLMTREALDAEATDDTGATYKGTVSRRDETPVDERTG